jgi:Zn ribbon nucleic-acid-binding protein
VTTALAAGRALSAGDRCDRCGAQAYIQVVLESGLELLFCAHHGRKHLDKLNQVAVDIRDETGQLAQTPAVAPEGES